MKTIDKSVLAGYNAGIEKNRLRSGIGLIEFERTKELLLENLPTPPLLYMILAVVMASIHGGLLLLDMKFTCWIWQKQILK